MCIATSVAELVSAYPVHFDPPGAPLTNIRLQGECISPSKYYLQTSLLTRSTLRQRIMSQSLVGLQVGSTSWVKLQPQHPPTSLAVRFLNLVLANPTAEMILAAVSLGTDFSYAPTNDQVVGVFIGVIFFHGLLNTLNTAWLARITSVFFSSSL
jgi:hypothetical protein